MNASAMNARTRAHHARQAKSKKAKSKKVVGHARGMCDIPCNSVPYTVSREPLKKSRRVRFLDPENEGIKNSAPKPHKEYLKTVKGIPYEGIKKKNFAPKPHKEYLKTVKGSPYEGPVVTNIVINRVVITIYIIASIALSIALSVIFIHKCMTQ
jgi:hypothetical protein